MRVAIPDGSCEGLGERISQALKDAAEELEGYGEAQSLTRNQRYRFLRYAPFFRELSGRLCFCKELSGLQLPETVNPTPRELYPVFDPVLKKIQLPNQRPPTSVLSGWDY